MALEKLRDLGRAVVPAYRDGYRDLLNHAEVTYCHLRSAYLQAEFVMTRVEAHPQSLKEILEEEIDLALMLYRIVCRDSRVGFEASNHYYYTRNDLLEKVLNCRHLMDVRGMSV
jgi:hypothetical protein